jgi:hypothetical protein
LISDKKEESKQGQDRSGSSSNKINGVHGGALVGGNANLHSHHSILPPNNNDIMRPAPKPQHAPLPTGVPGGTIIAIIEPRVPRTSDSNSASGIIRSPINSQYKPSKLPPQKSAHRGKPIQHRRTHVTVRASRPAPPPQPTPVEGHHRRASGGGHHQGGYRHRRGPPTASGPRVPPTTTVQQPPRLQTSVSVRDHQHRHAPIGSGHGPPPTTSTIPSVPPRSTHPQHHPVGSIKVASTASIPRNKHQNTRKTLPSDRIVGPKVSPPTHPRVVLKSGQQQPQQFPQRQVQVPINTNNNINPTSSTAAATVVTNVDDSTFNANDNQVFEFGTDILGVLAGGLAGFQSYRCYKTRTDISTSVIPLLSQHNPHKFLGYNRVKLQTLCLIL